MTESRPDLHKILDSLKPFQRATVEHAFRRLWTDEDRVDRFLVADEVGLGKTLVAKGSPRVRSTICGTRSDPSP